MFNGFLVRNTCILALCLGFFSGCTYVKSSWKETRRLYKEYVNPNPSLDLELPEGDVETEFSRLVKPIDSQLTGLYRIMNSQDRFPEDGWTTMVMERYSWVNGLQVVSPDGMVLLQDPEVTMKPLDIDHLLERGDQWNDRRVLAVLNETPLGPELLLAAPFFKDNVWQGLTIAHFDPRSLCALSPEPERLLFFTNSTIFCPSTHDPSRELLQSIALALHERDEVYGRVDFNHTEYIWLARTFGDVWLMYAMEADTSGGQ